MRNFWERGADIETERLRLRAWSMHAMQGFLLFAADPEVMMAEGSKPVLSAGGARALLGKTTLPAGVIPVCIGEETAKELYAKGLRPVVAKACTAEAIADAVAETEEICRD